MNEEGTFMWAVEQMKQGKKVRRKLWIDDLYVFWQSQSMAMVFSKDCASMVFQNYEATDWEIWEKPMKTLYDKYHDNPNLLYIKDDFHLERVFKEKDVKEALKEFVDLWCNRIGGDRSLVISFLSEIFGKELVE